MKVLTFMWNIIWWKTKLSTKNFVLYFNIITNTNKILVNIDKIKVFIIFDLNKTVCLVKELKNQQYKWPWTLKSNKN